MENTALMVAEQIQTLAARVIATQPAGHQLYLIGGFRYRLLDASCRTSVDIDYHWEGDLDKKQAEVVEVLRKRLLPDVKRQLDYDGDVRPASGPAAESPAVRIVEMAFYRLAERGSRIEIPLEITHIPLLDPPVVRTVAGTVFLTVSDADMIESKVIALFNRVFLEARDILDLFLFQDSLVTDSAKRLRMKFVTLQISPASVSERFARLLTNRVVHARAIDEIIADQIDAAVAANLKVAGGGAMIFDAVVALLADPLEISKGLGS